MSTAVASVIALLSGPENRCRRIQANAVVMGTSIGASSASSTAPRAQHSAVVGVDGAADDQAQDEVDDHHADHALEAAPRLVADGPVDVEQVWVADRYGQRGVLHQAQVEVADGRYHYAHGLREDHESHGQRVT